jgi:hypothetical protein
MTEIETADRDHVAMWTPLHSEEAAAQGWDMFAVAGRTLLRIEKLDGDSRFSDDMEAEAFVEAAARAGDGLPVLAMKLKKYFEPAVLALKDEARRYKVARLDDKPASPKPDVGRDLRR